MGSRTWVLFIVGAASVLVLPSCADALLPSDPVSTLHTYVPAGPPASNLSSLIPHCDGCGRLIPEKPRIRNGTRGFHRPPRHQGSSCKKLKSGRHLRFKPAGSHSSRPVALPRRALTRLGLHAQHFEGWQMQAVDGDTIRYGMERIRLRSLNTPELSEPGGVEAQQRLADLLQEGDIRVVPHGHDIYGRVLADVFISDRNVADIMTSEGFAKRR